MRIYKEKASFSLAGMVWNGLVKDRHVCTICNGA